MPFDLTLGAAVFMAVALLGAAFVRGYSGFGFAALVVSAASLISNPMVFVPVVILADLLMTVQQIPSIRGHIDWRRVITLMAGALVGVPFGIYALSEVGIDSARMVISLYVLAMCGVLLLGIKFARAVGDLGHGSVGLISGLANGAGVGGLPVAVFFAAQPIDTKRFRATLIAYFTLLDLWSLPLMARAGLVTRDTLIVTGVALPLTALGIWAGGRHFLRAEPQGFRRFTIALLAVLAILGLLKSWG